MIKYQFSTTWRVFCLLFAVGVVLAGCFNKGFERSVSPSNSSRSTNTTGQVTISDSAVVITSPVSNAVLEQTFTVTGSVTDERSAIYYRLRDSQQQVILEDVYTRQAGTNSFSFEVEYEASITPAGTFEVYEVTGEGESATEKVVVAIPVRFASVATTTINVFFNNIEGDPELEACSDVLPVERVVNLVNPLPLAALNALFGGPTQEDAENGFVSQLPLPSTTTVSVNSVDLQEGVLEVDFSASLLDEVEDECDIDGIESQITTTLLQFEEIEEVTILVDGEPYNDALPQIEEVELEEEDSVDAEKTEE